MHKINNNLVFCLFVAIIVVAMVVGASLGNAEDRRNKAYFTRYREADSMVLDGKPDEALKVYQTLAKVFPKAHIIQYKSAICELHLENYEAALSYALKTLEMHPWMSMDEGFMTLLETCFKETGDEASAAVARARLKLIE